MMVQVDRIPIRNLYYMLCYSWNELKQGKLVDVSKVPTTELVDLFATVLCDGIKHLARRGLEQGYRIHDEEIAGVRGRMDILRSARRFLLMHGRAACGFDELTANTLPNQILKSTLRQLARADDLNNELRKQVHVLHRDLHGIDDIVVTTLSFRRVQLHGNNRFYRFLLNVCELIQSSWLVDQQSGAFRFRDFVRDERKMAEVFQNFLFNFIRTEIKGWRIKSEHIKWRAISTDDPNLSLLPRMETDISLQHANQHTIIDAKYYTHALTERYDTAKVRSGHLYQLMSYLTNAIRPDGDILQGMLIYPRIDKTLRERYEIQGYGVTVATVDLNQDWQDLEREIIGLIGQLTISPALQ